MKQLREEYKVRREDYYTELDEVQYEINEKRFAIIVLYNSIKFIIYNLFIILVHFDISIIDYFEKSVFRTPFSKARKGFFKVESPDLIFHFFCNEPLKIQVFS